MKSTRLILVLLLLFPVLSFAQQVAFSFNTQNINNAVNSGLYIEFIGSFETQGSGSASFYLNYDEAVSTINRSYVSVKNYNGLNGTFNYSNGTSCYVQNVYARNMTFRINLPSDLVCDAQQSVRINLADASQTVFDYFTLTFTMKQGLNIEGASILCSSMSDWYFVPSLGGNLDVSWQVSPKIRNLVETPTSIQLVNSTSNSFLVNLQGQVDIGVGCSISKEIWFGKPKFHFETESPYPTHVPQTEHIIFTNGFEVQNIVNIIDYLHNTSGSADWYGVDQVGGKFRAANSSDWVSWTTGVANTCGTTYRSGYATFANPGFNFGISEDSFEILEYPSSSNYFNSALHVTPNPVNGGQVVSIELAPESFEVIRKSKLQSDLIFTLIGLDGKILQKEKITDVNNAQIRLNRELPTGLYFFSISTESLIFGRGKLVIA